MIGTDLGEEFDDNFVFPAGMVLVLEPVVWEDGTGGYRSEEIVVITEDGCMPLTDYPYTRTGVTMSTEILADDRALRVGRRERALAQMEAHDLDVLVLGRQANVRYVSGRAAAVGRRHPAVRADLRRGPRRPGRSTSTAPGTRASPRRSRTRISTASRGTR